MKNLLLLLWRWFIGLFYTNPRAWKEVTTTTTTKHITTTPEPTRVEYGRKVPRHNNRKPCAGRLVQYVDMGGYTRPIYHTAN